MADDPEAHRAGDLVRIVEPPEGVSNCKFRGRVGTVMYPLERDGESATGVKIIIVAVERRESERVPKHGVLAENIFEFVPVPTTGLVDAKDTTEDEKPMEELSWIAPMVVVPFRDLHSEQRRSAHLATFVPHMTQMLGRVAHDYRILVVEQSDDGLKFNRGQLLNIGYRLATQDHGCDAFVFHDVDLLPGKDVEPWYRARPAPGSPIHIARVWNRYSGNPDYCGGIASWNAIDFECINGFPNNYWGWGGEDDEMMRRCKTVWGENFAMDAPLAGTITDLEEMDLDQKIRLLKTHPEWKCLMKRELRDEHTRTWQSNGLRMAGGSPFRFGVRHKSTLGDRALRVTVDCSKGGDFTDEFADAEMKAWPSRPLQRV